MSAQIRGGTLPPRAIPKFVTPLLVPPAMPRSADSGGIDLYRIAVRQFRQQVLPRPLPQTTVWGYGPVGAPSSFHAPSLTIEAEVDRPVRVEWVNGLIDANGRYLPHLLPVDQTLHWANPPGGTMHRDMHGSGDAPYRGPVPIVTHLHGGHSRQESDGFTEAWYLPPAVDIPPGYATVGSWYDTFRQEFARRHGVPWAPGTATFQYDNDQEAGTLWYHDHALGITRLNVYTGPAGFYLLRGGVRDLGAGVLPGPAPSRGDSPGTAYHEIPLAIQDRTFTAAGSLFYPDTRAFFEGLQRGQLQIPFAGAPACGGPSDVPPIWNPEFFGTSIIVNGRTWPFLEVEPRRYRFRILNGCNSRFLLLALDRPGLSFWQVGTDGGFLDQPLERDRLLLAPAERADVVVDFSGIPGGTEIVMTNLGPDEPFGGGAPEVDFAPADPSSTGLIMQFRVVPATSIDTSTPPHLLQLPPRGPLPDADYVRELSLNEEDSGTVRVGSRGRSRVISSACDAHDAEPFGPVAALLGTLETDGSGRPLLWAEHVTETPEQGATEVWHIHNFTMDAHPIHLHQVMFEVVGRIAEDGSTRAAEPWEKGPKDTVIALPHQVTSVKATFDLPGRYVWHCHILEHEDNEMMRPLDVLPPNGG